MICAIVHRRWLQAQCSRTAESSGKFARESMTIISYRRFKLVGKFDEIFRIMGRHPLIHFARKKKEEQFHFIYPINGEDIPTISLCVFASRGSVQLGFILSLTLCARVLTPIDKMLLLYIIYFITSQNAKATRDLLYIR